MRITCPSTAREVILWLAQALRLARIFRRTRPRLGIQIRLTIVDLETGSEAGPISLADIGAVRSGSAE